MATWSNKAPSHGPGPRLQEQSSESSVQITKASIFSGNSPTLLLCKLDGEVFQSGVSSSSLSMVLSLRLGSELLRFVSFGFNCAIFIPLIQLNGARRRPTHLCSDSDGSSLYWRWAFSFVTIGTAMVSLTVLIVVCLEQPVLLVLDSVT